MPVCYHRWERPPAEPQDPWAFAEAMCCLWQHTGSSSPECIVKYKQVQIGPTHQVAEDILPFWKELSSTFLLSLLWSALDASSVRRSETAEAASGDVMLQIWMPNPPRAAGALHSHTHTRTHTWQRLQKYRAGERGSLSRQNILLIGSKTVRRVRLSCFLLRQTLAVISPVIL